MIENLEIDKDSIAIDSYLSVVANLLETYNKKVIDIQDEIDLSTTKQILSDINEAYSLYDQLKRSTLDTDLSTAQLLEQEYSDKKALLDSKLLELETLLSNELQREETFNNNETQRTQTFNTSESQRVETFNASESQRTETFNTNETQRDQTITNKLTLLDDTFSQNESQRTETFNTNETQRDQTIIDKLTQLDNTFSQNETQRDDLVSQKLATLTNGKDGKDFTFDMFTDEQLNSLKVHGDKGDPFTYDMFTNEQLDALKVHGEKGDPLLFSDLTEEQKAELKGDDGEGLDDSGWMDLKPFLSNGWVAFDDTNYPVTYRKIGQITFFHGLVKGGTSGVILTNLPIEIRPTRTFAFMRSLGTATAKASSRAFVSSSGYLKSEVYDSSNHTVLDCVYILD